MNLPLPWSSDTVIRDYTLDDAASLFVLYASIVPEDAGQMMAWTQQMDDKIAVGGQVLVMVDGRRPVAYAALEPLPGLPGVWDLTGGTGVPWRRRGYGSQLLEEVKERAAVAGARNLSTMVMTLTDEPARFLLQRGFMLDHEECLLELNSSQPAPPVPASPATVATYSRREAIAHFLAVYDASFEELVWSQPYSEEELAGSLRHEDDLLFLAVDGQPVGVAWAELLPGYRGRIEPMGMAAAWQGRGLGKHLLAATVEHLRARGAQTIEVGTWRINTAALNLYKRAGFIETANWYYLNYELAA